jgi:hypothetical protein
MMYHRGETDATPRVLSLPVACLPLPYTEDAENLVRTVDERPFSFVGRMKHLWLRIWISDNDTWSTMEFHVEISIRKWGWLMLCDYSTGKCKCLPNRHAKLWTICGCGENAAQAWSATAWPSSQLAHKAIDPMDAGGWRVITTIQKSPAYLQNWVNNLLQT